MHINLKTDPALFNDKENSAIELINLIKNYNLSIFNHVNETMLILSIDGTKKTISSNELNGYINCTYFKSQDFFKKYLDYITNDLNESDTIYMLNNEYEIKSILKFLNYVDQYFMGFNKSKNNIFDPDEFLKKVKIINEKSLLNNSIPEILSDSHLCTKI